MSRQDLIHVGEISENDECRYYEKWGDHDWKCSDCGRGYGLDPARPRMWPKKKISHYICQDKDKVCESCGIIETENGDIIESDKGGPDE